MFFQPTETACERSEGYVSLCRCRQSRFIRGGTQFPECPKCGQAVHWTAMVGERRR